LIKLAPFGRAFDPSIFHGLSATVGTTNKWHFRFSSFEFGEAKLEINNGFINPHLTPAPGATVGTIGPVALLELRPMLFEYPTEGISINSLHSFPLPWVHTPCYHTPRISLRKNANSYTIELTKRKLAALQKQKRGLMQKLLTGKWRVKTAREDGRG
jgi:hypothetical protein